MHSVLLTHGVIPAKAGTQYGLASGLTAGSTDPRLTSPAHHPDKDA